MVPKKQKKGQLKAGKLKLNKETLKNLSDLKNLSEQKLQQVKGGGLNPSVGMLLSCAKRC